MKAFCPALALLLALGGCAGEKPEPGSSATTRTAPPEAAPPAAAPPAAQTSSETGGGAEEPVQGVWGGQVRIDAHTGVGTFNYVGAESGDFVPMRFRTGSEAGAKILAACADEDLCEFEGTVRFLDEPPPENASAVGEIVRVDRVKKLPDAP